MKYIDDLSSQLYTHQFNIKTGFISKLFIIIGIIIMLISIIIYQNELKFEKSAIQGIANITDIQSYSNSDGEIKHVVYVSFEVDNIQYGGKLGYYSSNMKEGDTIEILYKAENPNEFRAKGMSWICFIPFMIGFLFCIPQIIIILIVKRKNIYKI